MPNSSLWEHGKLHSSVNILIFHRKPEQQPRLATAGCDQDYKNHTTIASISDKVPRRRRAITSWNIEVVVHSNSASSVVIFFHQGTPSLVSSPSKSPPSFPSPSLSTRLSHSLLDHCRHESHQTYSSYQLVSHLETSTTLFPAFWTNPRDA